MMAHRPRALVVHIGPRTCIVRKVSVSKADEFLGRYHGRRIWCTRVELGGVTRFYCQVVVERPGYVADGLREFDGYVPELGIETISEAIAHAIEHAQL